MDLASRCVGQSNPFSGPQTKMEHSSGITPTMSTTSNVPTTIQTVGLDNISCLQEQLSLSRDLDRYYSQHPIYHAISYHLPDQPQPLTLNENNEQLTGLTGRHPTGPPLSFPLFPPASHIAGIHSHVAGFHSMKQGRTDTTRTQPPIPETGIQLTPLTTMQPTDDNPCTLSFLPSLHNVSAPPNPFELTRQTELFGKLNESEPGMNSLLQHNLCRIRMLSNEFQMQSQVGETTGSHAEIAISKGQVKQTAITMGDEQLPVTKEYLQLTSYPQSIYAESIGLSTDTSSKNKEDEDVPSSQSQCDPKCNKNLDTSLLPSNTNIIPTEDDDGRLSENSCGSEDSSSSKSDVNSDRDNQSDSSSDSKQEAFTVKINRVVFCPVCRKGYGTNECLAKHMLSHGPHKCETCGKSFSRQCNLKIHMGVHADRNYYCEECGKSFKSVNALQTHKTSVHLNSVNGTAVCDACGIVLKNRKSLQQHEQMHTLGKRFACDLCDERFHRKDALNRHVVRIHVEEKFFTCQVCTSHFNTNEALQNHMWLHETERPYQCKCCKRRFPQQSALDRHLKTHLGQRPFGCNLCGLTFSRSYRLKSHMQRHSEGNLQQDLPA